jgi:hypothetical protein
VFDLEKGTKQSNGERNIAVNLEKESVEMAYIKNVIM